MATIQELETRLNNELSKYGAFYEVFQSTESGGRKTNGKHIRFSFPEKVKININAVVELFKTYYGEVFEVSRINRYSTGGDMVFNSVTLNLESGYAKEKN